jgi:hypothetical protein
VSISAQPMRITPADDRGDHPCRFSFARRSNSAASRSIVLRSLLSAISEARENSSRAVSSIPAAESL